MRNNGDHILRVRHAESKHGDNTGTTISLDKLVVQAKEDKKGESYPLGSQVGPPIKLHNKPDENQWKKCVEIPTR